MEFSRNYLYGTFVFNGGCLCGTVSQMGGAVLRKLPSLLESLAATLIPPSDKLFASFSRSMKAR